MTVDRFRYLWDGTEPGWSLVDLGADAGPDILERYRMIQVTPDGLRSGLLIEDDDEFREVKRRMLEFGVPVLPPSTLKGPWARSSTTPNGPAGSADCGTSSKE